MATVTQKGKVKGKKAGTATITAKAGKKKLTCKVTVKNPVKILPRGMSLSTGKITLVVGNTYQLKATLTPANTTDKSVSWTTSNKKVATVTSAGKVKAVAAGTAKVTATSKANSKLKLSCMVTVQKAPEPTPEDPGSGEDEEKKVMTSISAKCSLTEASAISEITSDTLTVTAKYNDGTSAVIKNYQVNISTDSSSNNFKVVITSGSLTTTIWVNKKAGDSVVKNTVDIELVSSKEETTFEEGVKGEDFTVYSIYNDGTKDRAASFELNWEYKDGYYEVTAKSSGFTKTVKVKVTNPPTQEPESEQEEDPAKIVVSTGYTLNPDYVYVGENLSSGQLTAKAKYKDGHTEAIDYRTDFTPQAAEGEYTFHLITDYGTQDVTVTVKKKEAYLSGLTATLNIPNMLIGDEIPKEAISVTGTWSDGTSGPISDFEYNVTQAAKHGEKARVTITAKGLTTSVYLTAYDPNEIKSATFGYTDEPVKVGEDIKKSNISVEATYYSGETKNTDDFTVDFTPKSEPGEYKFTVTCGALKQSFTATVVALE